MFIDINTYVGHWPFRNICYNTLEGLDELAQKHGITHMVVANVNGFFYKDANAANQELLEAWKAYHGKTVFFPMAIVKPNYPAWEKDAREMINAGFAGFELTPIYHGYTLEPEMLPGNYEMTQAGLKVLDLAEELDVPVRICASIENFRGRSSYDNFNNVSGESLYALLSRNRKVPVLVTSFSPFAAGEKFAELIKERPDTYFDSTQMETFGMSMRGDELTKILAPEQLCFGSLSPFGYMETELIRSAFAPRFDYDMIQKNGFRAFKRIGRID